MTTMTLPAAETPQLGTSNPRLPLLISKAGIEFDLAAKGKNIGFESVRLLSDFIKQTLGRPPAEGASITSLDSAAVGIIGRALTKPPTRETTITDVVTQAWEMAEQMKTTSSASDIALLEKYKRFCIELGNSLLRYGDTLSPFRSQDPHKR